MAFVRTTNKFLIYQTREYINWLTSLLTRCGSKVSDLSLPKASYAAVTSSGYTFTKELQRNIRYKRHVKETDFQVDRSNTSSKNSSWYQNSVYNYEYLRPKLFTEGYTNWSRFSSIDFAQEALK
eukprot:snap_masked-scaffold_14-processed-gene-4.25-mRNA-1 protein AED:1.00 eAED:1.00 QI:0/-1/0/0/-1/1/1/0/123